MADDMLLTGSPIHSSANGVLSAFWGVGVAFTEASSQLDPYLFPSFQFFLRTTERVRDDMEAKSDYFRCMFATTKHKGLVYEKYIEFLAYHFRHQMCRR